MPERRPELEIVSVNVGAAAVLVTWPTGDVLSGIDKRPVGERELRLSSTGLAGDVQADTRPTPAGGQVHGGPHQAVYAFPSEHYERIAEIVGTEVWPGYMGENLTVRGALEDGVHIGDVWSWGDARLQVSAPRGPCYKLGYRMGKHAARTVVREEGLVGWYFRVLEPATVPTTGSLQLVRADERNVSVRDVNHAIVDRHRTYPDIAAHPALAPNQAAALLVRDRDLTGGIPERD